MVRNYGVLILKLKRDILALESVQRSFTTHLFNMQDFDYKARISRLGLYSPQRRRERYLIIWKTLENLYQTFLLQLHLMFLLGCLCIVNHVSVGRLGSLIFNSFIRTTFRWKAFQLLGCVVPTITVQYGYMCLIILGLHTCIRVLTIIIIVRCLVWPECWLPVKEPCDWLIPKESVVELWPGNYYITLTMSRARPILVRY